MLLLCLLFFLGYCIVNIGSRENCAFLDQSRLFPFISSLNSSVLPICHVFAFMLSSWTPSSSVLQIVFTDSCQMTLDWLSLSYPLSLPLDYHQLSKKFTLCAKVKTKQLLDLPICTEPFPRQLPHIIEEKMWQNRVTFDSGEMTASPSRG